MCLITSATAIHFLFKFRKEKKLYKELLQEILTNYDNTQLAKLIKYSKEYITYTIDTKEVNRKNKIKDQQKKYSLLLEMLESQYILNNCKIEAKATKEVAQNIKSNFAEKSPDETGQNEAKNKKKEQ